MTRLVSLAFLVVGVVLLVYGVAASESIGSGFSRLFTGAPTDRTLWFFIGGALAAAVGLTGLLRGTR